MQELPPGNLFLQQIKNIFKALIPKFASQTTVELNIQKATPVINLAYNISLDKG